VSPHAAARRWLGAGQAERPPGSRRRNLLDLIRDYQLSATVAPKRSLGACAVSRDDGRENARLAAQAGEHRHWLFVGGSALFADAGRRADTALERLGLAPIANRPAGLLSHGDQRLL
jgi:hypothetical protein